VVYRAVSADGDVLYVGMSTRLPRRLKEHAKHSAWWPLAHHIERDAPLPLATAFRSECDQILALRPKFNQNGGVTQWHGPVPAETEAASWRGMYERGMTVEQIALAVGTNTGFVSKMLAEAGTVMRRPGQRKGTVRKPRTDVIPQRGPVVRVVFPGSRGVHRRRGFRRGAV
jgi:hypothetical protein